MAPLSFFDNLQEIKSTGVQFNRYVILPLILVSFVFLIRLNGIDQNTIFYDEAVNVTLGVEALAGDFTKNATAWTFGSNLYPIVAALSNQIGGTLALRVMTALLSTITAGIVYAITRVLFSDNAALWALLLFGFSAASINLGQLAVYDSLAIPLLALATWGVVKAAVAQEARQESGYLLLASMAAILSILTKYIGLLYLPVLGFTTLQFFYRRKHTLKPIILWFVAPIALILTGYLLLNQAALVSLLERRADLLFVPSARGEMIRSVFVETGFLLFLALVGSLVMPLPRSLSQTVPNKLLFRGSFLLLVLLAYMAPIYQIYAQNIQSLWKHLVYSSLYLAPLAGYSISYGVYQIRHYTGRGAQVAKLLAMSVMIGFLIWYVDNALDRNWGFLHSWPNSSGAITYLEGYDINKDTRILAEQSAVYEYYFDVGPFDRDVWTNTFYSDYRGAQDLDAMLLGIRDGYFDLVILDNYYTEAKNVKIRQALTEYEYTLVYQDSAPQDLSTDKSVLIQIYSQP